MGLEMFSMQNQVMESVPVNRLQMRETNYRLGIGFLAILVYLIIGAIVFVRIERPAEQVLFDEYVIMRSAWEQRLTLAGFGAAEIDELFGNVRYMAERGVWQEENVTADSSWTFGRSFFFCGALLTTVGYGSIQPRTTHGKLFTIFYCIVGIPLTLALLSALAHRLRYPSIWLRKQLNLRLGHMFHAIHLQWLHLFAVCALLFVFVLLLPSLVFCAIEQEWTFIDAIYFCFVSLSTIGLGDVSPGDDPGQSMRGLYKFLVTVYLISGLACMMLFLATLYDIPQLNIGRFFVTKSDADDDDEDRPIHMQKSNQPYGRYNGGEENGAVTPNLPFTATNGFYQ